MVTGLFRAPAGLVAVLSDEDGTETEVPIIALALQDTGEITGVAWSEKQTRFHDDVSDPIYFPGFQTVEMSSELDDAEPEEEEEDAPSFPTEGEQ